MYLTLFIVPLYTLYYDIIAVSNVNIVSIVDKWILKKNILGFCTCVYIQFSRLIVGNGQSAYIYQVDKIWPVS